MCFCFPIFPPTDDDQVIYLPLSLVWVTSSNQNVCVEIKEKQTGGAVKIFIFLSKWMD